MYPKSSEKPKAERANAGMDLVSLKHLYSSAAGSKRSTRAELIVPPHRFGFIEVSRALNAGAADAASIEGNISMWQDAELDWTSAVSLVMQTKVDVSYEQLEYLGLESGNGLSWLAATIRIKRALGYGGGAEEAGSTEYVAFWADWDGRGTYSYLGTAEVRAQDAPSMPASGSVHAVEMPIDRARLAPGKAVRVRAVLSWGVPPSSRDPYALTTWGNCIEAQVQTQPGAVTKSVRGPAVRVDGLSRQSELSRGPMFASSSARFARVAAHLSSCR